MLAAFGTIVISAVISTVICASCGLTGLAALAGAGVVMALIGE